MAYNGSGTFSLAESAFVFDTVISETEMNSNLSDIATGLSTAITKDGQTTLTANLPMNSKKLTGLLVGSAEADSATLRQIQAGAFRRVGTAGGTNNALTISPSPAIEDYATGQRFTVVIGGTSSDDAATLAVSGLTTKAIEIDNAALSSSVVLVTGKTYDFEYDGTAFQATRLSIVATTGTVTASSTDTFTNKTIDADATGNVLSNIDIGNAIAASQAEAEAGTDNTKLVTSLRVKQAIDALSPNTLVQEVSADQTTFSTTTTIMADDDTIPQNTEGTEVVTLEITPKLATNRLEIEVTPGTTISSTASVVPVMALFQDSTAGALAASAGSQASGASTGRAINPIKHIMVSGTTSATTFKVRVGPDRASTLGINGDASTRRLGGVGKFVITIKEYTV